MCLVLAADIIKAEDSEAFTLDSILFGIVSMSSLITLAAFGTCFMKDVMITSIFDSRSCLPDGRLTSRGYD